MIFTMSAVATVIVAKCDNSDGNDALDDVGCTAEDLAERQGNEECRQAIADCLADSSMMSDQHQQRSPGHTVTASMMSSIFLTLLMLVVNFLIYVAAQMIRGCAVVPTLC